MASVFKKYLFTDGTSFLSVLQANLVKVSLRQYSELEETWKLILLSSVAGSNICTKI